MAAAITVALGLAGPGTAAPTTRQPVVRPELPVTASLISPEQAQNSPMVADDPTDPRYLAMASRVDAPEFDCQLHLSGDGGRTWQPSAPVPRLPEGAERCYAPEIAFDRHGVLYYLFVGLHGSGNTPMGVFLSTSVDRQPFGPPRQVLGADRFMVRMVLDPAFGKQGRIHLVWLAPSEAPGLGGFALAPAPILSAQSDDGGATFSAPVEVSEPGRALVVAPAVALGRDGAVHVAYYDLGRDRRDYQGLDGPTWEERWSLVIASSFDRGEHFTSQVTATDVVPPRRVMLIFTMAPPAIVADARGAVFVSWDDARNGDWDVLVAGSHDAGRTFGPPLRLNDDPLGNGVNQYLPRLSLAPGGRLDAVFYDRRDDPEGKLNNLYYTWSEDGGRRFAPNLRITSEGSWIDTGAHYAVPSAAGQTEIGSRLALLAIDSGLLAAWTDTRNVRHDNDHQDIFSTQIVVAGVPRTDHRLPLALAVGAASAVLVAGVLGVRQRRRGRRASPTRCPG